MPNGSLSSLLFILHILYHKEELARHERFLELSRFSFQMSYVSPIVYTHLGTWILPGFLTGSKLLAVVQKKKKSKQKITGGKRKICRFKTSAPIKIFLIQICLKAHTQKSTK